MRLTLKYFASLKEEVGKASEVIHTEAINPGQLFLELKKIYQLSIDKEMIKVAINWEYKDWESPLKEGDEIVFIPPVAGG